MRRGLPASGTLLALAAFSAAPGSAAVLRVDTVLDGRDAAPGDGICFVDAATGCSYRAALEEANADPDADEIHFVILGPGPHVLSPSVEIAGLPGVVESFPPISEAVFIDGFSHPDSHPNGLRDGDDAVHPIVIEDGETGQPAVAVEAEHVTVRGLHVRGSAFGIRAQPGPPVTLPDFTVVPGPRPSHLRLAGNRVEGNQRGIEILSDDPDPTLDVRIGGFAFADRNVVFDNGTSQISLHANDSVVQGNYVGTEDGVDPSGSGEGFEVVGDDDQVIANVVLGFVDTGLFLAGQRIQVQANRLQADPVDGFNAVGLEVSSFGGQHEIGPDNVIAGNGIGILIGGEGTEVFSNAIGVESNRVSPVPNFIGIRIEQGDGSLIGGAPARGNVIARNLTAGVVVAGRSGFPEPQGHSILGNRMFRNFDPATFDPQPGIDLGDDGVTTNDLVDADPGPNGFQNHPVLTSVTRFIDNTFFEGSLHARPGRTYRIELYSTSTPHPSSHCEGEFFIGSVDVTADANGNALFPDPLGFPVASPGILFTATATDVLSGDTSEFGPCFQANGLPGTDVSLTKTSDELVVAPGSSVTFLVTVHNRGPGEVSSLEVVDLLPAGLDWQTHLASQGSYDPGTGVWDVGDVPAPDEAHPEQVATLEIQALVTAAGGTLTNVAAIPPQGLFDADLGDNSAEVNLEVRTGADVELSHSVSPPAADVGGELAFTLTVRNKGPEDATGVKVFGFLPEELGAPVADAPETVGFRASDGLWTWDVGDLARDAARILVLRATVEERSFEDLTHTASALVGAPGDEAPENNLRSVRFGIGRATDLKIDFLTGRIVGSNVIWTIGISNDGPDDSLGFVLDAAVIGQDLEALPGGGTVPGLDCFLTPGPPFRTVTCNFVLPPFDGVLAAGQSVEGDFAVSPLGGDAPAIGVKIETGDFDPDFGNNQKFSAFGIDCFIATAAFGSVLDPHVQALRDFRDAHLLTNAPGRAFVRAYYALSPPLAAVIAEHPTLRTAVRLGLAPLLLGVAHPRAAAAGGIVAVLIAGTGWTLRGRRRSIS